MLGPPPKSGAIMLQDPAFTDEAPETGYRLCYLGPSKDVGPKSHEGETIRVARCVPMASQGAEVALCAKDGTLWVVRRGRHQEALRYQIYLGAVVYHPATESGELEEGGGLARMFGGTSRTSRPKPVGLTWDGLAFVPTLPGSLFFLLGPSNTVLYTNLSESRPGGYVYGSHVIALDKHGARVRCMAVNSTGMLLATGDEKGNLRVWPLLGEHPGSTMMKPMGSLGNVMPDDMETKRWSEVKAHEGPVWAISHIDGVDGVPSTIVSGGAERTVKLWQVFEDPQRHGTAQLIPSRGFLTETCQVTTLRSYSPGNIVIAGTDRGTLYLWSMGQGGKERRLNFLADHASSPLLCLDVSSKGTVVVTGDDSGIVRLYRLVGTAWNLVAECPLDGPVIEAGFSGGEEDESLMVCSSQGMVKVWQVSSLPHSAEEALRRSSKKLTEVVEADSGIGGGRSGVLWGEQRQRAPSPLFPTTAAAPKPSTQVPPPPQQQQEQQQPPQFLPQPSAGAGVLGRQEEEEDEEEPRRQPPPFPTVPAPTTSPAPFPHVSFNQEPMNQATQSPFRGVGMEVVQEEEEEEEEEVPRSQLPPPPTPMTTQVSMTAVGSAPSSDSSSTSLVPAEESREVVEPTQPPTPPPIYLAPSALAAPALHTTGLIRDALLRARAEKFDPDEVEDTESVLEEAAKAVNIAPNANMFPKNLVKINDAEAPPPPKYTRMQVDPSWVAKQELRPTPEDFYTPDLEHRARSRYIFNPAPSIINKSSSRARETALDPCASLYKQVLSPL